MKKHVEVRHRDFLLMAVFFLLAFFVQGCSEINRTFSRPIMMGKTRDAATIVIYDSRNRRFVLTDRRFRLKKIITHPYFSEIWGFCLTDQNELVVTNNRVLKESFVFEERKENAVAEILFFDLEGNLLKQYVWYKEQGPIIFPGQVTAIGSDSLYVTDYRLNRVVIFNRQGQTLGSFGEYGDEPGKLYYPNDLIETADGNLLIADCYNSRLQLFDKKGDFLKIVADKGEAEGKVKIPEYFCLDDAGNIYCTELFNMRVSVFDRNYAFKRCIYPKIEPEKIQAEGENVVVLYGALHLNNPDQLMVVESRTSRVLLFDAQGTMTGSVGSFTLP